MRFVQPLDEALLLELAQTHHHFITLEEHALMGGFGSAVGEFVLGPRLERPASSGSASPARLIQHEKQTVQRALHGLSKENLAARVKAVGAATRMIRC